MICRVPLRVSAVFALPDYLTPAQVEQGFRAAVEWVLDDWNLEGAAIEQAASVTSAQAQVAADHESHDDWPQLRVEIHGTYELRGGAADYWEDPSKRDRDIAELLADLRERDSIEFDDPDGDDLPVGVATVHDSTWSVDLDGDVVLARTFRFRVPTRLSFEVEAFDREGAVVSGQAFLSAWADEDGSEPLELDLEDVGRGAHAARDGVVEMPSGTVGLEDAVEIE